LPLAPWAALASGLAPPSKRLVSLLCFLMGIGYPVMPNQAPPGLGARNHLSEQVSAVPATPPPCTPDIETIQKAVRAYQLKKMACVSFVNRAPAWPKEPRGLGLPTRGDPSAMVIKSQPEGRHARVLSQGQYRRGGPPLTLAPAYAGLHMLPGDSLGSSQAVASQTHIIWIRSG
jgi:hypothetical protein